MFINKDPFMVSVSRGVKFKTSEHIKNSIKVTLVEPIRKMLVIMKNVFLW